MIQKIMCLLGFHDYEIILTTAYFNRVFHKLRCEHCFKKKTLTNSRGYYLSL